MHGFEIDDTRPRAADRLPKRDTRLALKRGMRNLCPACGEGRLRSGYLRVNAACPACGEELHHHRADDFPQYVTIFVVGHVLVAALLVVDELWPNIPVVVHYLVWPPLVILLCLWLLPIFKAMLIAYQWALRMHGFETAHRAPAVEDLDAGDAKTDAPRPDSIRTRAVRTAA